MTKQDIGFYLMVLLISSALAWLVDVEGTFSAKEKITISIGITLFIIVLRISIYLMVGT